MAVLTREEAWWSGPKGDAYQDRNQIKWSLRTPFWADLLTKFQPCDILEVGCAGGWNLLAIRSLKAVPFGRLCGCDINEQAITEARVNNLAVENCSAMDVLHRYGPKSFDLVFTCGLLIHVPPDEILRVMSQIKQVSRRLVLAVEYADKQEVEVTYRGEQGLLWRRNYGELYEAMGLKIVDTPEAVGFDRCNAWMLERTAL